MYDGLAYNEAAEKTGIAVRSMRRALTRPAVLALLKEQRRILLASESARNLRRLAQLRDQEDNKAAAVRAAQVIEQIPDQEFQHAGARPQTAGLVIVIQGSPSGPTIVTPSAPGRALVSRDDAGAGELPSD